MNKQVVDKQIGALKRAIDSVAASIKEMDSALIVLNNEVDSLSAKATHE